MHLLRELITSRHLVRQVMQAGNTPLRSSPTSEAPSRAKSAAIAPISGRTRLRSRSARHATRSGATPREAERGGERAVAGHLLAGGRELRVGGVLLAPTSDGAGVG